MTEIDARIAHLDALTRLKLAREVMDRAARELVEALDAVERAWIAVEEFSKEKQE